jgi:lysozyme
MDIEKLKKIITDHEEYRRFPYMCTGNKLTIAIGRNIQDVGISEDEAQYILQNDIDAVIIDLIKIFPGYSSFTENRQHCLADMRFQLGPGGFRGFKKMIAAILIDDWIEASMECINSKYATDTPSRAVWVAEQLRHG